MKQMIKEERNSIRESYFRKNVSSILLIYGIMYFKCSDIRSERLYHTKMEAMPFNNVRKTFIRGLKRFSHKMYSTSFFFLFTHTYIYYTMLLGLLQNLASKQIQFQFKNYICFQIHLKLIFNLIISNEFEKYP